MPRDLLIGAGATVTGQWTRVEPPGAKTWPFRVMFTDGAVAWSAGNVLLEEIVGSLPVSPGPLPGNPGLLTAGNPVGGAGTIKLIGTFGPGAPDFTIDAPVEFIRARTDGGIVGNVNVRLLEAQ